MAPRVNAVVRSVLRLIIGLMLPLYSDADLKWTLEMQWRGKERAVQREPRRRSPAGAFRQNAPVDIHARTIGGCHLMHDGRAERQGHPDHASKAEDRQ